MRFLVLLVIVVGIAQAAQLDADYFKQIFKFADPSTVEKLTANLNKDKTNSAKTSRVSTWIKNNFVKPGTKVDATDPLANKDTSLALAKSLISSKGNVENFFKDAFAKLQKKDLSDKVDEIKDSIDTDKLKGFDFKTALEKFKTDILSKLNSVKSAGSSASSGLSSSSTDSKDEIKNKLKDLLLGKAGDLFKKN